MGGEKGEYLLALNAAEGLLQVLVAGRETGKQPGGGPETAFRQLCGLNWEAPSQGAELLAPVLRDACSRLHVSLRDIGRIAVVRGPGSFTGLRLVLATASGLAGATNALRAGLDYLPLLAQSAVQNLPPLPQFRETCRVWVVTHARRRLVHLQGFFVRPLLPEDAARGAKQPAGDTEEAVVQPFSDVIVCSPEEGADRLLADSAANEGLKNNRGGPVLLLGSGLDRNRESFLARLRTELESGTLLFLPRQYNHPAHAALLRAACLADFGREEIDPFYVRPSDAEENLAHIARTLGLDPEEARGQLAELTGKIPLPD